MKQITNKTFYLELESLRAFAVLIVLYVHFIPKTSTFYVPYLWYGVDLFFTISGFLITSILLSARDQENKSNGRTLKNFYMRRVLRLFPIYYLFILFFYFAKHLGNLHLWKDEYNLYFFTYFQNMYYFFEGSFNSQFSHLWSLGVEEQFYMVWPFLVLFIPRKLLPYLFVFMIFLSLTLNFIFQEVPLFRSLTFSNFHTLGIGALFAFFHLYKKENPFFIKIKQYRTIISGFLFLTLVLILTYETSLGYLFPLISDSFLALTTVSLVIAATYGWQYGFHKITQNKALMMIGKISYGVYLFHLPLPSLVNAIYGKVTGQELNFGHELLYFLFYTSLTIILAHFSFKWLEMPFLKLKSKFI